VQGRDDDVHGGRLRGFVDDPLFKIIANAVAAEHHVVEVDKVAANLSAVIQVEATFVFKALREKLQHLLLALPVLLDVQEVRRRPVRGGISTGQFRVVHEGAEEVLHVLSREEGLLDDVVKLAQKRQLLSGRELMKPTIDVLRRRLREVPFSVGPDLARDGGEQVITFAHLVVPC